MVLKRIYNISMYKYNLSIACQYQEKKYRCSRMVKLLFAKEKMWV